jgi:ribosomal protein L17
MMNEVTKKVRGKASRPAMIYFPLRVSVEVAEYFETYPNKSKKIREVLEQFIQQEKVIKDENSKQEITEVK